MADVVLIAGSPSPYSRTLALLDQIRVLLSSTGLSSYLVSVRDFDPQDLIYGRYDSPAFVEPFTHIKAARGIVVATPVYKAAYSGVLKTFLDLVPANAFAGKPVLPLASGGTSTHMLMLEYALKPVLSALGAQTIHTGFYVADSQMQKTDDTTYSLDDATDPKFRLLVEEWIASLSH